MYGDILEIKRIEDLWFFIKLKCILLFWGLWIRIICKKNKIVYDLKEKFYKYI